MADILVVDDEVGIRNVLAEILMDSGYTITTAANAEEARRCIRERKYSLILLDIWMPDTDGITLLREWRAHNLLTCPVIMMSGHGTIDSAMQAVRYGAMDFLEKPISLKNLLNTVDRVLEQWQRLEYQKSLTRANRDGDDDGLPPSGAILPVFQLPEYNLKLDFNLPFRDVIHAVERAYFETTLQYQNLSMARLARHSGIERTHLYRKMKAAGVELDDFRIPGRLPSPLPAIRAPFKPKRP